MSEPNSLDDHLLLRPPHTLVVAEESGFVHRQECRFVNYYTMRSWPPRIFDSVQGQEWYAIKQGWRGCLVCKPFDQAADETKD